MVFVVNFYALNRERGLKFLLFNVCVMNLRSDVFRRTVQTTLACLKINNHVYIHRIVSLANYFRDFTIIRSSNTATSHKQCKFKFRSIN